MSVILPRTHKRLLASFLLVSGLFTGLLVVPVARAQEGIDDALADEFALLEEEDVVLTAAKHKQKAGFSPAAVIVITREEIERSGAVDLIDLLRRYPAIDIYEYNPAFYSSKIRGNYRILMLLDGREVNLELFTLPFYTLLPVGLHQIERIEIVLGPNSALYGANAVSAVINVATRRAKKEIHADASLAAGSHGNTIVELLGGGGLGSVSFLGSVGVERGNSWMDRDELARNVTRANGGARLELPGGSLTVDGGLVTTTARIYAQMGYLDTKEFLQSWAKAELELADLKVRAYWSGLRTTMDLDLKLIMPDTDIELARIPTIRIEGDTAHVEAQYDLELFGINLLIAGVDFRITDYRSDQTVEGGMREFRGGLFLHDELRVAERLLLTAGIRFDINSKTDFAVSPRGAAVYNPGGEHFLRLSAGTAFRKPSLLETSANFKVDENPAFPEIKELFEEEGLSDPDLMNEELTTVELGYRGAFLDRALRVSVDLYLGFSRETITFGTYIHYEQTPLGPRIDVEQSKVGYNNVGDDTNSVGAHFSIEADILTSLTLFCRGDLHNTWLIKNGNRETTIPLFRGVAGATLELPFGFRAQLAGVYVASRNVWLRSPISMLIVSSYEHIPGRFFFLGSLSTTWHLGTSRLDLGLSLFNPFGAGFREEPGVWAPDGSNYGGELLGTRIMATARLRY